MVIVSDGQVVDFGQENHSTGVVGFLECEFALFLVQIPDLRTFMACTSNNSSIIRTDIHNPFLMTQKLHNVLALPLALLLLANFLDQ